MHKRRVTESLSDAQLVVAAREGQPWAQRALFDRYSRRVTGLAHRLLGGGPDVDDLVQDAFVAALTGLENLRDPDAFRSWLFGITARLASKRIRRRKLRRRFGFGSTENVPAEAMVSKEAPADVAAELNEVYRILDSLPAEAAIALVLRRVEGMTTAEVAETMNLSPATVKRRLAHAEERLAKRLKRDES